jgi:hypothetical protein
MPGPMPYYLEKGPALSVIESFVNDDADRLRGALDKLRAQNADGTRTYRVTDCGIFDTDSFNANLPVIGGSGTKLWASPDWKRHIDEHWFGLPDINGNPTQTFWGGYTGENIEGIVREALVRAIETAFRVKHGEKIPAKRAPWRIEFWWKCGQNWFETWLTWRPKVVSVMFCTPTEVVGTHHVWGNPVPPGPPAPDYDGRDPALGYSLDSPGFDTSRPGMAVVGHNVNTDVASDSVKLRRRQFGESEGVSVGATYRGSGTVVVVEPSEPRGGIKPGGRKWVKK